jgi:HCOMODA/2-hydroxy-3-carboxy-muconic semialdehyde decarboxylase
VADTPTAMRDELAVANRILAHEGILDAFGHVSLRHPAKPDRYLLARSCAPALVEPDDIYEYDLESRPTQSSTLPHYSERVIHGEIYKARPDVMAVCHHHAPAFMPLLVTGTPYQPVFPLGAVGGADVAFWDQHREFGDSNLLVTKPEEGRSLAEAFGANWMVLMNQHGVTVGGVSLQDVVFRCIYSAHNAA